MRKTNLPKFTYSPKASSLSQSEYSEQMKIMLYNLKGAELIEEDVFNVLTEKLRSNQQKEVEPDLINIIMNISQKDLLRSPCGRAVIKDIKNTWPEIKNWPF